MNMKGLTTAKSVAFFSYSNLAHGIIPQAHKPHIENSPFIKFLYGGQKGSTKEHTARRTKFLLSFVSRKIVINTSGKVLYPSVRY
jgi:hypothetical protein